MPRAGAHRRILFIASDVHHGGTQAEQEEGRHKNGHTPKSARFQEFLESPQTLGRERDTGATRRDRTGDLLITNRKELINQRLTRKVTE